MDTIATGAAPRGVQPCGITLSMEGCALPTAPAAALAAAEAGQLASTLLSHGHGMSPAVQGWPTPSLWAALTAQRREELTCLAEQQMGQ